MVEVGIDQGLCLHFLLKEEVVGGAEISLNKVVLGGSMTKENVTLVSMLHIV